MHQLIEKFSEVKSSINLRTNYFLNLFENLFFELDLDNDNFFINFVPKNAEKVFLTTILKIPAVVVAAKVYQEAGV